MTCVRFLLVGLTTIILVAGSASVGYTGYIMIEDMKYKGLTGNQIVDGSILGTTCFIFITGFFGCVGATLQKKVILKIFFVLFALFLLAQITLAILYFVEREQLSALLKDNWDKMTDEGRIKIQKELSCCGMKQNEGYDSYIDQSCFAPNSTNRHETCFKKMEAWVKNNMVIVGSSGGALILLEVIALALTFALIREIGRETTVVDIRNGPPRNRVPRMRANVVAPRPVAAVYDDEDDIYMEDYEQPEVNHARKNWAKQSYRQEWKTDKRKR